MKIKFLFLAFFMTINVSLALAQKSQHGGGGAGGGTNIMERSILDKSNTEGVREIQILNSLSQEIDRVDYEQIEYYLQHLASGKYTAIYFNNNGSIIDRVEFAIE